MQQSRRTAATALVALALSAALTSCASAPAEGEGSTEQSPSESASTQSVAEACGTSGGEIAKLTDHASAEVAEAGKTLAGGEVPDLSALGETLTESLDEARAGVENSKVSGAITDVRGAAQGFAELETPGSLFEAPGYVADLSSQLEQLNTASGELQKLCGAG